MKNLITISPNIQSGAPVFANTRVPVKNLFDYLKGGDSLDESETGNGQRKKSLPHENFHDLGPGHNRKLLKFHIRQGTK